MWNQHSTAGLPRDHGSWHSWRGRTSWQRDPSDVYDGDPPQESLKWWRTCGELLINSRKSGEGTRYPGSKVWCKGKEEKKPHPQLRRVPTRRRPILDLLQFKSQIKLMTGLHDTTSSVVWQRHHLKVSGNIYQCDVQDQGCEELWYMSVAPDSLSPAFAWRPHQVFDSELKFRWFNHVAKRPCCGDRWYWRLYQCLKPTHYLKPLGNCNAIIYIISNESRNVETLLVFGSGSALN